MGAGKKKNFYVTTEEELKKQFDVRARQFDISAKWITDEELIQAHVELAGNPHGEALDLCCGTGRVGKALKEKGWDVKGLDATESMVRISSDYFPTFQGKAEDIPFEQKSFYLIVCRQSFQFLDAKMVLSEITRVLAPEGIFILSLTVPFSDKDSDWLYEIHQVKQPLLLNFYTAQTLMGELKQAGFLIEEIRTLKVRESINRWMEYAPELTHQVRNKVISMIKKAPSVYKKLHKVEVINGEVFEDWNWIVLKTSFSKE